MEFDNKKLRGLKKTCRQLKKNINRLLIADINRAMALKEGFYETESAVSILLFPEQNISRRKKLLIEFTDLHEKQRRDSLDICLLMQKIITELENDFKNTATELDRSVQRILNK